MRVAGRHAAPVHAKLQGALIGLKENPHQSVGGQINRQKPRQKLCQPLDNDPAGIIVPDHGMTLGQLRLLHGLHLDIERRKGGLYITGNVVGRRCSLDNWQDQLNLAQHRVGHLIGDALKVPLGKNNHHHKLNDHNRQHQNERCTAIDATGQITFEPDKHDGLSHSS